MLTHSINLMEGLEEKKSNYITLKIKSDTHFETIIYFIFPNVTLIMRQANR